MGERILLAVALASIGAASACDDDSGESYDNSEACYEVENAVNDLECYDIPQPVSFNCDAQDEAPCNTAVIWECMADVYYCDGDELVFDEALYYHCYDLSPC